MIKARIQTRTPVSSNEITCSLRLLDGTICHRMSRVCFSPDLRMNNGCPWDPFKSQYEVRSRVTLWKNTNLQEGRLLQIDCFLYGLKKKTGKFVLSCLGFNAELWTSCMETFIYIKLKGSHSILTPAVALLLLSFLKSCKCNQLFILVIIQRQL